MKEIVFVGLGLDNEMGISLNGLEEIKSSKNVFIELYTNLMPNFSVNNLELISGKKIQILSRQDLEENQGEIILNSARKGKTVFLVPGDPLIATTHISLRLEAQKRKIVNRVVHGVSIISAIIGQSGLQNYKFGKTVTIPLPENSSATPYNVIRTNKENGLHTLCLLDINSKTQQFLSINKALRLLLDTEKKRRKKIVNMNTIVIGVARIGSESQLVKAGYIEDLLEFDFGDPPQSLIFPGKLHFIETETLIAFANAPKKIGDSRQ